MQIFQGGHAIERNQLEGGVPWTKASTSLRWGTTMSGSGQRGLWGREHDSESRGQEAVRARDGRRAPKSGLGGLSFACLGGNMTFALRSRRRIEYAQGTRDSSDPYFKKREKSSFRVCIIPLALLISQFS